jgi:flagellar hook protein FlgE
MSIVSLYTAVGALQAHQQFLSTVANNLANVNTVGFKGSRTLFADSISQTVRPPTQSTPTTAGGNGVQVGLGTKVVSIQPIFSQGALQSTGLPADLAIEGGGFFVVTNPVSGTPFYTRAGAFSIDNLGNIVTPTGEILQGSLTDPAADGDALGNMNIPASVAGDPVVSFSIDGAGRVNCLLQSGVTSTVGTIALERFNNPEALVKVGSNKYQASPASGQIFNSFHTLGTDGLGVTRSGLIELSNVDLGQEFSDMIRAQRGLQANARVITTSDEVIQDLVNLKR